MTGIVKRGAEGFARVRPFAFADAKTEVPADPRLVALEARVVEFEAALAESCESAARLKDEAEAAYAKGEEAGRAAGLAEADKGREATLERLDEAAGAAVALLAERLDGMERLAALLASTCIERMFGDTGGRADLVCDLVRRQADSIRDETIVHIHVSAEDFDGDAPARIAAAAGRGCEVAVSDALASGDCTIRLGLGALEIGLGQQWGGLRAALTGAEEAA